MSINEELQEGRGELSRRPTTTIGIVEDVSDAFQLGKIRIRCNQWGDTGLPIDQIPQARFCSPFGGVTADLPRGVNESVSQGQVAYGQWNIPQVGSRAVVMLIDGDQNNRVWVGVVPDFFFSHTMPHGRYLDDKIPLTSTESPIEPLATNVKISFDNQLDSPEYATRVMDRQVSAVRGQDIGKKVVVSSKADEIDQVINSADGSTINRTQGYLPDRDSAIFSYTTPGFHTMAMDDDPNNCRIRFRTTSGHQIIMDDTNERIYISTSKGNTWIEIDEKGTIDIYGSEDISMSADSDINILAKKTVRIGAGEGIHLTSGTGIRAHAKEDVHLKSDADIKTHSANFKLHTDANFEVKVDGVHQETSNSIIINSDSTYDLTASGTYTMTSSGYDFDGTNIMADGNIIAKGNITSAGNITAAGVVTATTVVAAGISATGSVVSAGSLSSSGPIFSATDVVAGTTSLMNHSHQYLQPKHPLGPGSTTPANTVPSGGGSAGTPDTPGTPDPDAPAVPATSGAAAADELSAYFVTRMPTHEPYARSYLDKDQTDKDSPGDTTLDLFDTVMSDINSTLEYPSTNPSVGTGSAKRGKDFARNTKWRR